MSSSNLVRLAYKKEATYGVKQDAVPASKVIQDLTYTALKGGELGNSITVAYVTGGTAGAEVVTVQDNTISIQIQSGTSTAAQVRTAVLASMAAMALLASVVVSGTGSNAQTSVAATPLVGGSLEFKTARFTSEKYSGTPTTTESAQIRTDRQSSGQIVTGLTVAGGHNFELAKEAALEDFMESAMLNEWDTTSLTETFSMALDATAQTITRTTGDFTTKELAIGDVILLTGFSNDGNNVPVMITNIQTLVLTYAGPTLMVTETHSATYTRADKLTVGINQKSLSIEKTFLDLTTKALIYKGVLVDQMEIDVAYGSLISGSFSTVANDYETADAADEFISDGEYIAEPATTDTLNGSVDMPFITTDVAEAGVFDQGAFCLQSLKLTLANNSQAQTCIGKAAPEAYSPGTADLKVELSSYLKDSNWDLLARKISQAPFALGFMVKNVDGWYAFYMPAIQVSFDDPASGGQNQQISMDMTGTAKVGANGESELAIYRLPG